MKEIVSSAATTTALIGILSVVFFFGRSTDGVIEAQRSWSFSAPSFAATPEVGACYDGAVSAWESAEAYHWDQYISATRAADVDEAIVLGVISAGYTTAVIVLPPPWNIAVAIAGGYQAWRVTKYYDGVKADAAAYYDLNMSALTNVANNSLLACDDAHLNGGDPENAADQQVAGGSSGGVSIIGGSQSIGGIPSGRVHVNGPL